MQIKSAILCLIITLISACRSDPVYINCCPLAVDDVKDPQTVKEYLINNEIYLDYIKKCKCLDNEEKK